MDDVKKLTKEEFLKFLNCSDQRALPKKFFVKNRKNQIITLIGKPGVYEADDVKIEESSINNKVVRIPLPIVHNLKDLSARQARVTFRPQAALQRFIQKRKPVTSSFGRKLKKKDIFGDESEAKKQPSFKIKLEKPKPNPKSLKTTSKLRKSSNPKITSVKPESDTSSAQSITSRAPKKIPLRKPVGKASQEMELESANSPGGPSSYFLKFDPIKYPDDGKLTYSFEVLVKDIKNMKLPSASWKIKVIVRNSKIASIIFTNKCVLERTVTFTAKTERYEITLENRPAILLGAPNTVDCVEDIEILLNIIHTISAKSPMVYYKS